MTTEKNGTNGTGTATLELPAGMQIETSPQVSKRMLFEGLVPMDEGIVSVGELGQGCHLTDERKGNLTHARCYTILELPEFIVEDSLVDRNLRDNHVTYLMNCMKRGTFHPEWVTIITCICAEAVGDLPPESEIRMNGQHTCWARLGLPDDYPCPVRFQRYRAATVADMRLLYASIDRGRQRSQADAINAHLAGTEQFAGMPRALVKTMADGLSFWLWGNDGNAASGHDADDIAHEIQTTYKELSIRLCKWIMSAPREHQNHLMRSPVLAAMFETFSKLPTQAHKFWDAVRDGIGFTSRNDPAYKLHDGLKTASVTTATHNAAKNRQTGKKSIRREDMYRWCIYCWNAWRDDQPVKNLVTGGKGKRPRAK